MFNVALTVLTFACWAISFSLSSSTLDPSPLLGHKHCTQNKESDYMLLQSKQDSLSSALNHIANGKHALRALLMRFEDLSRALRSNEPSTGGDWLCANLPYPMDKGKTIQWNTPTGCLCFIHAGRPPMHFSAP